MSTSYNRPMQMPTTELLQTHRTLSNYNYVPSSRIDTSTSRTPPYISVGRPNAQNEYKSSTLAPYNNNNGYCDVPNCGKLLWVSRDSHKSRSTPSLVPDASGGYSNDENFEYNIRTGLRIQPFTPQPSHKRSYLANQSAIQAALPLVMRHSQSQNACKNR